MDTLNGTTLEQIEQLKKRIEALKEEGEVELRRKLAAARLVVEDLERQLSNLTGRPSATEVRMKEKAGKRIRRPSISDEELKAEVLKAVALHGQNGINAKAIGEHIGQDGARVRKFLKDNPKVLKRVGAGPGTKFYLP